MDLLQEWNEEENKMKFSAEKINSWFFVKKLFQQEINKFVESSKYIFKTVLLRELISFIKVLFYPYIACSASVCSIYIIRYLFTLRQGVQVTFFKNTLGCWSFCLSIFSYLSILIFIPYFKYLRKQYKNVKDRYSRGG